MSSERVTLKAPMTVSKAISLITNKYSVSLLHSTNIYAVGSAQHDVRANMQCEMVERHVRALNRIANNFKSGIVSRLAHSSRT